MKARIIETGEEITIDGSAMSIFDIKGRCYYLSELTFIKDETDWEQRRYEIAKDCLAGYASNSSDRIMNANVLDQIETSIKIADVLIEKLKGGEK